MLVDRPPSHRLSTLLASTDYFRRSPSRLGGRGDHKEWQHFLVHGEGVHLLVNFSLLDETPPGRPWPSEVARLIVLARSGDAWAGDVERFEEREVAIEPGRLGAALGRNTLRFEDGAWHLSLALRDQPISATLELAPVALPALSAHYMLAPQRPISWLFVPRLEVRGTLHVAGRTITLHGAPGYHDHNWGHFLWADDFCWEWGSALPADAANPWAAVLVRVTDRGRSSVRYQALFLWRGGEPARIFRNEELAFSVPGYFHGERPFNLPRPLALLAPGSAADLPRRLEVRAKAGEDELCVDFETRHVARLLIPAEADLERLTVIHEALGRVTMRGRTRGHDVEMEGAGVFEFIRG